MKSGPRIVIAALAACLACLGSPASATSGSPSGAHGLAATDVRTLAQITSRHSDVIDAVTSFDDRSSLERDGRQLTAFTASTQLFKVGSRVLDAFLGVNAGDPVDGIAGGGAVPTGLSALVDNAITEIDAVVKQSITKAFNNEKKTLLDSLAMRVSGYRRSGLLRSRAKVRAMLNDASELVNFFADNEVVANGAFQATLALRLALQLELLQLEQLLGESKATLAVVRNNIRSQARTAKADLESWRSSYLPVNNKATRRVLKRDPRFSTITVCMDLSSPGLKKPTEFCGTTRCRNQPGQLGIKRCMQALSAFEKRFRAKIKQHVKDVALEEWRDLNEEAVFGEGFRQFLADLAKVENLDFGSSPPPPPAEAPEVVGGPVDASVCCGKGEECCDGGCVPKEDPLASSGLQRFCLGKRGCCPPPPPSDECASNCCQPGLDCVCGGCTVWDGRPVLCAADSGSCCTDPDNRCATDV